eukprot:1991735-Rhodomonas_salina.1
MPQLCGLCRQSVVMHNEQGQRLGMAATSTHKKDNNPTAVNVFAKYGNNKYWDKWEDRIVTLENHPGYTTNRYIGPLTTSGYETYKKWEQRRSAIKSNTLDADAQVELENKFRALTDQAIKANDMHDILTAEAQARFKAATSADKKGSKTKGK